ncbi:MAG: hypothetical protein OHK0031_09130 [Anaerolineales bacterium]
MSGRKILAALIFLLLTGCAPLPAPTPPPPSATLAPPATSTPLAPPTLRPTYTLEPSATPPPSITPRPFSQEKQRFTFQTEDGRTLVGYFYPAAQINRPVIVLMHQNRADQTLWNAEDSGFIAWLQNFPVAADAPPATPSARGLLPTLPADLTYNVFTFDFRGHGESGGDPAQDFSEFILDARAAYQFAAALPYVNSQKILGIGTSIGADAVVDGCGSLCAGAFSISPGSYLGQEYGATVSALLQAGKPIRCMYANNDGPSPATCWSVAPSDLYKIFSYPGNKHGMTFFVPRKMEADFGQNIYDWIRKATE